MVLLPAHQLYGSTILCDPSNQTNCNDQRSVSNSGTEVTDNLQHDNTETHIIIPDILPTDKDLGDADTETTNDDSDGTDAGVTNNDNDNTNNDNENGIDRTSDGNDESDDDDQPSTIPFP